ncbi:putative short-chain dehydrogenase [Biscogniauxia mediterranea]|nr:putative short-chain dehydrogenase [Biscogniauxia mediterranea]
MSSPVWFITGASNGLGLLLSLRALQAKHRVIGTVRSKTKSAEAVKKIESAGGKVIEMDMTEPKDSITKKVKEVGQIDYLINNAGYAIFGALEQMTEQETIQQISTNFFGPVFIIQAALEGMRARRSGLIVNLSSIAAKDPLPSSALYAGTKAGLEAVTESLAIEVEPFGIKTLIVNPGAFRTNFLAPTGKLAASAPLPRDYADSVVGKSLAAFDAADGSQKGDPAKGVERMFEIITGAPGTLGGGLTGRVKRLVLGEDALRRMKKNNAKFVEDYTLNEEVALSTDY